MWTGTHAYADGDPHGGSDVNAHSYAGSHLDSGTNRYTAADANRNGTPTNSNAGTHPHA